MLKNSSYLWWQENGTGWIQEIKNRKTRQVCYHIQELVLLDYFSKSNLNRILEFGCGFGRHLQYLREIPNLDVFGYDQSESMVGDMIEWVDPIWIDRHIKVGIPGEPLPYPDHYFDAVFTTSVLIHIPPEHIEATIKEILRVAKKQIIHQEPSSNFEVRSSEHNGCWNHNLVKIYEKLGIHCEVLRPAFKIQSLYRVLRDCNDDTYTPSNLLFSKFFDLENDIQVTLDNLSQEKDGLIENLHTLSQEKDGLIENLHTLSQEKDGLIENLHTLSQEKDGLIENLHTLSQEKNELVNSCSLLRKKSEQINQSNHYLLSELLEIKSSRTWLVIMQLKGNSIVRKFGKFLLDLIHFLKIILNFPRTKNLPNNSESIDYDCVENSHYQFLKPPILHKYQAGSPISVIIICYNKENELPFVISSIAKNTLCPNLVVLCDDESTDSSIKVFTECCMLNSLDFKIVQEPEKKNGFRLNTLRNNGISVCPDGLVIILDADHTISPTHIQAHVDLHLSNPFPVLSTGQKLEYANPDCTGPVNFLWGHEPISMMQPSGNNPIPSWTGILVSNMAMCKQSILDLGGFDSGYDGNYGYDDIDFTYRAWLAGYFFASCFESYVIHIPHPPSLGKRDGRINQQKFQEKYNIKISYPRSASKLTRTPWHEYLSSIIQDI